MPSRSRRGFLAGLGALTGTLTGCSSPSGTGDSRTARREVGEPVAVDGMELTVRNPRVRKLVVWQGAAHDRLRFHEGQYLLVDVLGWERPTPRSPPPPSPTPPPPPPGPFDPIDVALDGQPQDPDEVYELADVPPHQTPGSGGTYQRHTREGEYVPGIAIPVPIADVDSVAVSWSGDDRDAAWELPADVADLLASAPEFEIASYEIAPVDDRTVEMDVAVKNSGDRAGLWFGQHSTRRSSANSFVGMGVPAGTTERRTFRLVDAPSALSGRIVVQFESVGVDASVPVNFSGSTSTETA